MKRFIASLLIMMILGTVAGCSGIPGSQTAQPATSATPAAAGTAAATEAGATASTDEPAAAQDQASTPESEPVAELGTVRVVADAKVVPIQNADLSMAASGIVDLVLIKEGDEVQAGQMLIKLNGDRAQVAVAQAQANLQRAEAGLAQVMAGAREQEITAAEAALAAATANFERLAKGAVPGNIASAQAGLAQAQANLASVQEGASEAALIAAKADLMNAEAQLRNATSAYNRVKDESDIGMRAESLALEQATIAYESAKARMQDLENGATPGQIAVANAGVRQAKAQLDTLQNSMPSDLAAAQAEVDRAQAQLDLVKAGARPEAIAVAEAEVAGATAALQQALVALSENELRAPFGGLIATLNTAVGQQVGPGAPVISLADTSAWEIETSDLTELDVVGVQPGDPVRLTFDAIPDLTLAGTVSRIRPIGEDNRGDTVYKVVVTPAKNDPRLLWNMTAVVEFGE